MKASLFSSSLPYVILPNVRANITHSLKPSMFTQRYKQLLTLIINEYTSPTNLPCNLTSKISYFPSNFQSLDEEKGLFKLLCSMLKFRQVWKLQVTCGSVNMLKSTDLLNQEIMDKFHRVLFRV